MLQNKTAQEAVIEALEDPQWDYRTVTGISKDTGLEPAEVQACLDGLNGKVAKGPVPYKGESTYALRSRRGMFRMALDLFQATR